MLVLLVLVLDKLLDKQLGQAHRLGKPTYAFATYAAARYASR